MDGHPFFPDDPQLQFDVEPGPPPKPKKRHLEAVRARPVDPRVRLLADGAVEAEAEDQNEVRTSKAPLYDIVIASRNPTAKNLSLNANRVEHDGQVGLDVPSVS